MRVLLTGSGGALGTALRESVPTWVELRAFPHAQFDVRNAEQVAAHLAESKAQTVINAAAYTNVDGAENHPEDAFATNALGPGELALACRQSGARLVHVSTDYVFDGAGGAPYTEDAPTNPLGVYAKSKREGELRVTGSGCEHLIVRTSWLYGTAGVRSFPHQVLRWAKERDRIELVADQAGSPTYAPFLAHALWGLVRAGASGLLHWAGAGRATRYELGLALIEAARQEGAKLLVGRIEPVPVSRLSLKAPRPADSSLDCSRAAKRFAQLSPAPWQEMARAFITQWAAAQPSTGI